MSGHSVTCSQVISSPEDQATTRSKEQKDQLTPSEALEPNMNNMNDDQSTSIDGVHPTRKSEVCSVKEVPSDEKDTVFHPVLEDEDWTYPEESNNYRYINGDPYETQYHNQHMHLSNVLERNLTEIHSELCQLSRSVLQLAYGLKECADTMGFYTTRMLAFQQEINNTTSDTNITLKTGVHLLQDLIAKHEPCLANYNNRDGKSGRPDEGNSKRCYRNIQPKSSNANSLRYSKRQKK
ncbi:uncharacterized protein ACNLHF_013140 isoform 3-T3 [Anomaloglossus baeobatrachus]|uniref:uncharacterized protein LOC142296730 isoform X3 n=1 Tax=Anomaloglossus baeobatrachus TaxID=238106 RepID=UPI003F50108C